MIRGRTPELEKQIRAAKKGIDGPDDLKAAAAWYLTSLERACSLREKDDPEMLRAAMDDQIWSGIQFISMLRIVPPECWGKHLFSVNGKKGRESFKLNSTDKAEAYVAKRIAEVRLTRSADVSQTAHDIRKTWDKNEAPIRSIRWIEERISAAKKRAPQPLRLVK
jgi:hypothetical protein